MQDINLAISCMRLLTCHLDEFSAEDSPALKVGIAGGTNSQDGEGIRFEMWPGHNPSSSMGRSINISPAQSCLQCPFTR